MKKEIIYILLFISLFFILIGYGLDRIEKINNGEMQVVSESYKDR